MFKRVVEFHTEYPFEDFCIVSSDAAYFNKYAKSLFMSALETNNNVLYNIVNPDSLAVNLSKRFIDIKIELGDQIPNVFLSYTYADINKLSDLQKRVYYASDRFFLAKSLITKCEDDANFYAIDIDSVFKKRMPDPKCDLGLWLRQNEQKGMNTLAGMCYFTSACESFLVDVTKYIEKENFKYWFVDQTALYFAFNRLPYLSLKFRDFSKTPDIMDWEFKPDTYLWTGKGPRKHDDVIYVKEFDRLELDFNNKYGLEKEVEQKVASSLKE